MKRRRVITGAAIACAAVPLAGTAVATFRLHAAPRRAPLLSDTHLGQLRDPPSGRGPRVLFVGNSMTLRHDLPSLVLDLAAQENMPVQGAVAAARGSRLVETWQIDAFRRALETGWDILVLQDFSTTCLRAPDRWGSAYAMRKMAQTAGARSVVLFPTWAFPPQHDVYRNGAGVLSRVPENPQAFARCITAHYDGIAQAHGWVRAAVTEAMQPDATPWLEEDLHHPNPAGSLRIAQALWHSLRPVLARYPA